ncbi:GNAT family N-acetyltransferase [Larkinella soli]|uniref:GNAT family N-acetyltransferase n=1 Tax=Larkinella soli TaxID=1770527 RepID=UPI000FFBC49B|nr:GNAT family N-acetyltransferase [Larkinella soli]
MTINIRPYTPADREAVIGLLRLNTPRYFAESEEGDLIYYLENHAGHYFVLEEEGRMLGCGGFNLSDDGTVGKISWDFFHPEHQGRGLGSRLTRYRIEKLKEHASVKTVSVRTSQMAWRFYEKQGFELKEVVLDYWAPGFDLYRMECRIDAP